jgi:hypothetical protein
MDSDDSAPGLGDDGESGPASADEVMAEVEAIRLTPTEHQRVKDLVNGEQLSRITGFDRRYLVVGAGGETGAATRREIVYDLLDARTDPPAVAMRLEDFGLTPEELRLWSRVFDILCGRATHIVGVIEDFEGGYVWELGLLFAPSYREKVWVLKRRYPDDDVERERYDNGMAISHVKLLLTGERCLEWVDVTDLRATVSEVP